MRKHLIFLLALWKANLLGAMEYRVSFITQVVGMMLNDGVYFLFWVVFFNRFKEVRGWELPDMVLLFGLVAAGFGLSAYLFGNAMNIAELISQGQLDYYLSMPRPVLLHILASRSISNGLGDASYGFLSFLLFGQLTIQAWGRFILGTLFSMVIFLSFMILVQSLAFWMGNASLLSGQVLNAMLTFSIYPINMFDGTGKFLLYTLIPAAFVGAIPAEFVRAFSWGNFGLLVSVALVMLILACTVFYRGLKRYESGSAIQSQV